MAQRHVTLPVCPNCGKAEEAVGHWQNNGTELGWHCFSCHENGELVLLVKGTHVAGGDAA